jgi:hypothetical protein
MQPLNVKQNSARTEISNPRFIMEASVAEMPVREKSRLEHFVVAP